MSYGEAPRGETLIAQLYDAEIGKYEFELYPELWASQKIYDYYCDRQWTIIRFVSNSDTTIPTTSGIYMFVVAPCCGKLKDHTYIFYVGQTKNLKERYGQYLYEQQGLGSSPRKKVVKFLNHLKDHVYFHFTEIPENELDEAESLLRDNLTPPANEQKKILGRLGTEEQP